MYWIQYLKESVDNILRAEWLAEWLESSGLQLFRRENVLWMK